MSLSAAAIRLMVSKGLSGSDIADIAEANESRQSPAAIRQKRYRDNKRDVTRDVTQPPIDNTHTPSSVSNETVGEPTIDPVKQIFDIGVGLLTAAGSKNSDARSFLGKLRKDFGDGQTLIALIDARNRSITNPIEWLPKRLKGGAPPSNDRDELIRQSARYAQHDQAA